MQKFKILIGFLAVILLLVGGSIITFKFLSPVDEWVCTDGEWAKKGNPGIPPPNEICEKDQPEVVEDIVIKNNESNFILKFPAFWKDNYEEKVVEEDGIRRFIFNYKAEGEGNALLFILNVIPGVQDVYSVENQPNNKIVAQSEKYYYTLSQALDIPFMPGEPDRDKYIKMIEAIDDVIENSVFGGIHGARTKEIIENDHEEKWNINVSYPRIVSLMDTLDVNDIIEDKVDELVREYKENLSEWDATGAPNEAYSALWLNYRLMSIVDDIIVLEFSGLESFRGAAYPNGFSFSVNYDLKNNKEIKLSDIFKVSEDIYLEKLSETVKANLETQFKAQEFETNTLMFKEGTKALAFNFKNFNLMEDNIIFNFDPSHLAPRGLGSFKVEIDYNELSDVLFDRYVE